MPWTLIILRLRPRGLELAHLQVLKPLDAGAVNKVAPTPDLLQLSAARCGKPAGSDSIDFPAHQLWLTVEAVIHWSLEFELKGFLAV